MNGDKLRKMRKGIKGSYPESDQAEWDRLVGKAEECFQSLLAEEGERLKDRLSKDDYHGGDENGQPSSLTYGYRRLMQVTIIATIFLAAVSTTVVGILFYYHKQSYGVWVTFVTIVLYALLACLTWQDVIWKNEVAAKAAQPLAPADQTPLPARMTLVIGDKATITGAGSDKDLVITLKSISVDSSNSSRSCAFRLASPGLEASTPTGKQEEVISYNGYEIKIETLDDKKAGLFVSRK